MGMFDDVNFSMACPTCGKEINSFQTKDLDCTLDIVEPDDLTNFYAGCRSCGTWVEFTRGRNNRQVRETKLTVDQVLALGFTCTATPRNK